MGPSLDKTNVSTAQENKLYGGTSTLPYCDDASQKMEVIDVDTWLDDYATRRYGAESESATQAWDIF